MLFHLYLMAGTKTKTKHEAGKIVIKPRWLRSAWECRDGPSSRSSPWTSWCARASSRRRCAGFWTSRRRSAPWSAGPGLAEDTTAPRKSLKGMLNAKDQLEISSSLFGWTYQKVNRYFFERLFSHQLKKVEPKLLWAKPGPVSQSSSLIKTANTKLEPIYRFLQKLISSLQPGALLSRAKN